MRLLFVTSSSSIHSVRWISQLEDQNWDLHLFPPSTLYLNPEYRNLTVHTLFKEATVDTHPSVRQEVSIPWPFRRGKTRIANLLGRLPGDPMSDVSRLARLIRKLKPDVVHSTYMDGGFLALNAYNLMNGNFPKWIHSSWGIDFSYFGKQQDYSDRLSRLAKSCRYLIADCQRDVGIVREFGFAGDVLGVYPTAGGYHTAHMRQFRSSGSVSSRRVILLKGRQGTQGGRALIGLQALEMSAKYLSEYEIVIYLPSGTVAKEASCINERTGLRFRMVPTHTTHDELIKIMGTARVAIGVGLADGTPNAMLEAMVMGAFPIQSATAATDEWISDGETGFVVPPEDPIAIAAAIKRAVTDNELVERAAEMNERITSDRIDVEKVRPRVIELYERVACEEGQRP